MLYVVHWEDKFNFQFSSNNNIVFLDLYKMLEATGQSSCVSAVTTYWKDFLMQYHQKTTLTHKPEKAINNLMIDLSAWTDEVNTKKTSELKLYSIELEEENLQMTH